MAIGPQGPIDLAPHLSRLAEAAEGRCPWVPEWEAAIAQWAGQTPSALRLSLDIPTQTLWARREALPATPRPYRLRPLPHPLPWVDHPRRKGLDGPWNIDALQAARAVGADDALLLWPGDRLAETAIATLAVEREGVIILPPESGRVAGLGERLALPRWAEARGLRIETRSCSLEEARQGRLWCVNALRGVWDAELHLPSLPADSES